jgi:FHS family Na+ dependent glucose MFS transporter 1
LAANFIGALLSLGLIFLWPENEMVLWLGSFGFGLSIAPIFPTMLTFAGHHMAITGRVTSLFFVGATVGGMMLPWIIGQYFEKVGSQFVVNALFVDMAMAAVVFSVIFFLADRTTD